MPRTGVTREQVFEAADLLAARRDPTDREARPRAYRRQLLHHHPALRRVEGRARRPRCREHPRHARLRRERSPR